MLLQFHKKVTPPIVVAPYSDKFPKDKNPTKKQDASTQQSVEVKDIDVGKIKLDKPLETTDSLLEFIIIVGSKSLELPPKQIVALLVENCNYFAHLIVKGIKGSYK